MQRRYLGAEVEVSALTLGTMNFGKDVGPTLAAEMLARFRELGGTTLDTADCYSDGVAEEILGDALSSWPRESFVLVTKTGRPMGSDHDGGYSPTRLRVALEASLQRLQVDYIDSYQLHQWDSESSLPDALAELELMREQGKIRGYGIGNMPTSSAGQLAGYAAGLPVRPSVALQYHYSAACRDAEVDLLELCRRTQMGFMAWSPLSGGLLTGKYAEDPVTDRVVGRQRRGDRDPDKQGYGYLRARSSWTRVVPTLAAIAERRATTAGAVALAWLLARPGVSTAIIGARDVAQVDANATGAQLRLSESDVADVDGCLPPAKAYPYDFLDVLAQEKGAQAQHLPRRLQQPVPR